MLSSGAPATTWGKLVQQELDTVWDMGREVDVANWQISVSDIQFPN
jgi:hypothetical protein